LTLIWSILFIVSYYKANIENKFFRISAKINILTPIIALLSLALIWFIKGLAWYNYGNDASFIWMMKSLNPYMADKLTYGIIGLVVLLFIISFIIFMIGYFKNKKVETIPSQYLKTN
jgi:hypothetical protein